MRLAIVLDNDQAKIFIDKKPVVDKILSFCPSAKYLLEQSGYEVIASSDNYGSLSHAKNAVIINNELDNIADQAQSYYSLNNGQKQALQVYLYHYLANLYYIYFSSRRYKNAERFFWVADEKLRSGTKYDDVLNDLLSGVGEEIHSHSNTNYSFLHFMLVKLINKIHIRYARSQKIKIMNFGNPLPKKIIDEIISQYPDSVSCHSTRMNNKMLRTLSIIPNTVKRFIKGRNQNVVYIYREINPFRYRPLKKDDFNVAIKYKFLAGNISKTIREYIPFLKAEYDGGYKAAARFQPNLAICDHAKYPYIRGGLDHITENNIPLIMMNHGSHTFQEEKLSKIAANLWAKQDRMFLKGTKYYLPKSPLTNKQAREIYPDAQYELYKINHYKTNTHASHKKGDKFRIIQACNHTDAMYQIPWCKETTFEYLLATQELIDEVIKLDNVKLTIKLKASKSEVHDKIINAYISKKNCGDKVVVDTSPNFNQLLSESHLLISNLSAAIEEASVNNIPILIHTYHKGYFHLPASFEPASEGNYSLTYGIRKKEDLAPIINSIIENYDKISALKNAEIAWQRSEQTGIPSFAARVIREVTTTKS